MSKQMNNNEHIKQCETHVKNAENQLSLAREELEKAKKDDGWKHDVPSCCRWLRVSDGRLAMAVPYGYGPNERTVLYIDRRGDLSWGGEAYLKTDGWRYAKPGEVEIRW